MRWVEEAKTTEICNLQLRKSEPPTTRRMVIPADHTSGSAGNHCPIGVSAATLSRESRWWQNSWHSVLRNVPKEVTSLRTAVRIQTRVSMVSGL